MIKELEEQFIEQFNALPIIIKAPGRINLIGEHTDYNNGFVLPAAIDKAMYFAFGKPKNHNEIQIQSLNFSEVITIAEDELVSPSWGRYFAAIMTILRERGLKVGGLNCLFGGDIPIGAGMSSSAALCCGFVYGVSTLFDFDIPKKEIALIAQQAEHRIGLNCGLMDQYAVLFGKEDQVFCLDCETMGLAYFSINLKDYALVLIDSKIEHQLEGSPYNDRRNSCERVVAMVQNKYSTVRTLRNVSIEMLYEFEQELDSLDLQRAKYVINENDRVKQMIKALQEDDFKQVGAILLAGHQGMSEEYNISLPEIDFLVDLAKKEPTVLGARMMGGGFGGCTINLIETDNMEETVSRMQLNYQEHTGIESAYYPVRIGAGMYVVP